jgi:hypothetical protein
MTRNVNSGLMDLNVKRHFCKGVDRILHEEDCVKQLQQQIQTINELELSSFQIALTIEEEPGI